MNSDHSAHPISAYCIPPTSKKDITKKKYLGNVFDCLPMLKFNMPWNVGRILKRQNRNLV